MELQRVNVKLMVRNPAEVSLDPLIPVFHRWIQDKVFPELLLDIADYRHVHEGPGMVLIGFEANYSVDNTDGRLGVRYNRKAVLLDGSNQDRLAQAARSALLACQLLEADPLLAGKLRFGGQEIEISINDRLLAPNNPAMREAVDSELKLFAQKLFRGDVSLSYAADPRSLLAASVKAASPSSTETLLANLAP